MNSKIVHRFLFRVGAWALLAGALILAPAARLAAQTPVDPEVARRTQWFHEAKFGMLITWGLYSIPAGEWKGQEIRGIGEWIQNRARIPAGRVRAACPAVQSGEVQCRRMGHAGEASWHALCRAHAEAPRWFCAVRYAGEHLQHRGRHSFPPRPDAGVGSGVPQARAAHGLLLFAGAGLASTGRRRQRGSIGTRPSRAISTTTSTRFRFRRFANCSPTMGRSRSSGLTRLTT